ncbi:unnamed protein product, partial [Rotaria sordida]
PIHDIKDQLSPLNIKFIDKSLSGHCSLTKTCATNLKVINGENGLSANLSVQKQFYEVYKNDYEMNQVDIFMCFYPPSMCEMFMPFNRTIIIIAPIRYELGRFSDEDWNKWNQNLKLIASNPRNLVAANNLYDAEYIRYFTGINTIVLPSLCLYTKTSYNRSNRKPYLIAPIHSRCFGSIFMSMLSESSKRLKIPIYVAHLRDYYKIDYEYYEIAQHPAIIYIPYQVSIMSLFEQYRMNIPLFFPTLDLLTEWHFIYRVVSERTWHGTFGNFTNHSTINGVLNKNIPDPNNEFDLSAIKYWLNFSDFYQWPYINYFNSTDQLISKLKTTNLDQISQLMKIYNANLKKRLFKKWKNILYNIKPVQL